MDQSPLRTYPSALQPHVRPPAQFLTLPSLHGTALQTGRSPTKQYKAEALSLTSSFSTYSSMNRYPLYRPRRMRRDEFSRRLVRENALTTDDLIYPVFVTARRQTDARIASMPGVERIPENQLLQLAERCMQCRIPALALFPALEASLKTPDGREALNPDG